MHSSILCMLLLTEMFQGASESYTKKMDSVYVDRLSACIQTVNVAETMGVSMSLVASLGYQESGFDEAAVSSAGAVSVLQVIPRYVCPKRRLRGCDLVRSGIAALKRLLERTKSPLVALCRYNAGNRGCTKKSRGYARSVLRRQARLRAQMKHLSYDFMIDDRIGSSDPRK